MLASKQIQRLLVSRTKHVPRQSQRVAEELLGFRLLGKKTATILKSPVLTMASTMESADNAAVRTLFAERDDPLAAGAGENTKNRAAPPCASHST